MAVRARAHLPHLTIGASRVPNRLPPPPTRNWQDVTAVARHSIVADVRVFARFVRYRTPDAGDVRTVESSIRTETPHFCCVAQLLLDVLSRTDLICLTNVSSSSEESEDRGPSDYRRR